MVWNRGPSRAVFPSPRLEKSIAPVLGTGTHAATSPLPYGLGVNAIDASGARYALPLYFVSERVAASRGIGVLPGWYVAATPGLSFEICITLVHGNYRKVDGYVLNKDKGIEIDVTVDGVKPGPRSYQFTKFSKVGSEIIIPGFRESAVLEQGTDIASQVVRRFVFQKVHTVVESSTQSYDDTCGCIELKVYTGKVHSFGLNSMTWKSGPSPTKRMRRIRETESVKHGKSIQVGGSEARAEHQMHRSGEYIERSSSSFQGGITVYLREKFWLETRGLTCCEKQPTIDIDHDEESQAIVHNDARKGKEGLFQGNVEKKRKANLEVVDLTDSANAPNLCGQVDLTID